MTCNSLSRIRVFRRPDEQLLYKVIILQQYRAKGTAMDVAFEHPRRDPGDNLKH
jgi:hypothetical protein